MPKKLSILAPTRYPWRFNGPRQSRHDISVRAFLPLNKLSPKIEGITLFNPWPPHRFDLVHAFNRIPIGPTPFIIGFESHLPRAFGLENRSFFTPLSRKLAEKGCRRIIAISDYARHQFLRQHSSRPWFDALKEKLTVRYPNLPMPQTPDTLLEREAEGPVRLVFVGNHFGRKGGPVALRIAQILQKRGLPAEVHIVSSIETGAESWVDPLRPGFFDRDRELLATLPNIRHHGSLPNDAVLDLVRNAHFTLLPTFSDSFGYSVIESMANCTPAIVTAQGALPEFVKDGKNGIVLPLDTDEAGEWKHIVYGDRSSPAYEKIFRDGIEQLAEDAAARIETAVGSLDAYRAMRLAARATAKDFFCAKAANEYWDTLYEDVLS